MLVRMKEYFEAAAAKLFVRRSFGDRTIIKSQLWPGQEFFWESFGEAKDKDIRALSMPVTTRKNHSSNLPQKIGAAFGAVLMGTTGTAAAMNGGHFGHHDGFHLSAISVGNVENAVSWLSERAAQDVKVTAGAFKRLNPVGLASAFPEVITPIPEYVEVGKDTTVKHVVWKSMGNATKDYFGWDRHVKIGDGVNLQHVRIVMWPGGRLNIGDGCNITDNVNIEVRGETIIQRNNTIQNSTIGPKFHCGDLNSFVGIEAEEDVTCGDEGLYVNCNLEDNSACGNGVGITGGTIGKRAVVSGQTKLINSYLVDDQKVGPGVGLVNYNGSKDPNSTAYEILNKENFVKVAKDAVGLIVGGFLYEIVMKRLLFVEALPAVRPDIVEGQLRWPLVPQ